MAKPIDFTDFGPKKPVADLKSGDGVGVRWWLMKSSDDIANSLTTVVTLLRNNQTARITRNVDNQRLYGNMGLLGFSGTNLTNFQMPRNGLGEERLRYNVVQSVVDTKTAKIAKNKPKPLFLTNGGNWRQRRKAKMLTKFCEGVFYENKAYRLGVKAYRDSAVWGDGLVHVFAKPVSDNKHRVAYERVRAGELYVDDAEADDNNPRQMYRIKQVDRGVLLDHYPNKRDVIMAATRAPILDATGQVEAIADLVTVCEAWHLPSGPGAKDGKRVVAVSNGTLTPLMDWNHDYFPFAKYQYADRLSGYWGQSAVERLRNIQNEINRLLWTMQRSFRLAGSLKIFVENASRVVKEYFNNDIGTIIPYSGTKPEYIVPPVVPPQYFQQLGLLIQKAYEQEGVSQMTAGSQKPAGLVSGVALREYNDIESERFMVEGQSYENFFMDLAHISIETMRDIVAADGEDEGYQVKVPNGRQVETVDWADIGLGSDDYVMQCFPISSLPSDPAGRLQTVQEFMQAGLLSPREGRRLLEFPDLQQVDTLQNAEEELILEILDKITDEGIYTPPQPYDDLVLCKELGLETYALGRRHGLSEDRLEKLRQWMDAVDNLMQPPAPPAGPMSAGGPPMIPQAPPVAPSPNELIQNAPGVNMPGPATA